MPETIQSLWVGASLSTMERMCIGSFLRCGHPFDLYVYGIVDGVPIGATIRDATEIVPSGEIDRFQNLANFSDYFRYCLLLKRGGWWVDLDVYCLRPYDFNREHVFSKQLELGGITECVTSSVLRAPAGSEVIQYCLNRIAEMDVQNTSWAAIGPGLLFEANNKFGLQKCAEAKDVFCPLEYYEAPANLLDPARGGFKFSPETRSVHLWNEEWRRAGKDKDASYNPSCLYERLKRSDSAADLVATDMRPHLERYLQDLDSLARRMPHNG